MARVKGNLGSKVEYSIPMKLRKQLYNLGKGELDENELVVTAIKAYVEKVKPRRYKVEYKCPEDNDTYTYVSISRYKSLAEFNRNNAGFKGLRLIGKK